MLPSRDLPLRLVSHGIRISLVLLAVFSAAAYTLATPVHVKKAAIDSGIYGGADEVLRRSLPLSTDNAVNQAIESAVAAALSPEQLQVHGEEFIDGTYSWLDGSSAMPDFRIDLTSITQQLSASVGDEVFKRAQSLPICTPSQLQQAATALSGRSAQDTDTAAILALDCLPPGTTPEAVRDQAIEEVRQSNQLFVNPIVTAASLPQNSQGESFYEAAAIAPKMYFGLMLTPWILGGVCFILACSIYLMQRNAMRASYALARSILWSGILVLVLAGIAHILFTFVSRPGGSVVKMIDGDSALQLYIVYIVEFMRSFESTLSRAVLTMGAGYTILGCLAVVGLRLVALWQIHHTTRPG